MDQTVCYDRPRLMLRSFPGGQPLELAGPNVLVGRHSEADVRLPLPDISRRHCRLVYDGRSWWVIDLGSTNGTFVNNDRVDRCELKPGDHVRVGGFEFEVPVEDPCDRSRIHITAVLEEQPRRLAS